MLKKIALLSLLFLVFLTACSHEKVEVTFMVNDEIYKQVEVIKGKTVSEPERLTDGIWQDFSYWSTTLDGEKFDFNTPIDSNLTLYAIFTNLEGDPYQNISKEEFYEDYEVASSYTDAYWRTKHGFMSGQLEMPEQEPNIALRKEEDGLFLRNTDTHYTDLNNAWEIYDVNGTLVTTIYRGAAYIGLEEVAAYLFAFGDVPANYVEDKNMDPNDSIWGEYLRLNNTYFSGDTSRYPYEPELPDITGIRNGNLRYYEIDFGTTGTDCDPAYPSVIYNDGDKITRGAARLCYTRYYKDGTFITDVNERYVFYTYNHYNDFQEYLNYYGGWGEMFGNITGGGEISSKVDYNPTPYVETKRVSFSTLN